MSRRATLTRAAGVLGLSVIAAVGTAASGVTAAGATAPARPSPAARAAAAVARQGLLRRSDLGAGWSTTTAAPKDATDLACASNRSILASDASSTWSQQATAFASGTSYGFASVAAQRRAWGQTATAAMGRCLERQLQQGSSHGVVLRATGVRRLSAPRLPSGAPRVAIRRYEVAGTASGAGQESSVTLDVIVVAYRTWIGEDEFSAADSPPPPAVQARVVAAQARRTAIGRSRPASPSSTG